MTVVIDYAWEPDLGLVIEGFNSAAIALDDWHVAWERAITEVMIPSFAENFAAQGRPEPWMPLSEFTVLHRIHEGFGPGPILERTADLLYMTLNRDLWTVDPNIAIMETPPVAGRDGANYAGIAQDGSSLQPARPFIAIQEEDANKIEIIFAEQFDTIFGTAVLI